MHTLKIKLLDAQYKVLTKEARRRRISIHEIIDEWLLAGENETVPMDFTPAITHLRAISGDPDLLRRAFENLILNAIDAMPQGGRLRIATSSSNDNLIVEISDSGAGFDDEEASRLFTPYYTTKQHGTGLGLAIVQSVISDHGASISVSSRPGEGTIFRMEFQRKAKIQPADALAGKV